MDDVSHIRLVDTHAEGDGSHDYINLFHQEVILVLGTGGRIHSCMIGAGVDAVCLQYFGQLFYLLAAEAIDDARFLRIVLDELDDVFIYIVRFGTYFVIEVGTVEGRLEHLGFYHTQVLLDIVLHLWCGRSCQCDERSFSDFVDNGSYASVFRAEVVSPL